MFMGEAIFFFFQIIEIFFFLVFYLFILKSLILTCVPKHEPPSHLPPYNISVGHPHAPAPSMLYPASDIDWRFDSYMIVYIHFKCVKFESQSVVAQSCLTLSDPMDCSLPGSSVRGILQARILEWVAIAFSRGSSRPRD